MTTTTVTSRRISVDAPTSYDRMFYCGLAAVMAFTVLVGFGPTYYLRAYFGPRLTVTGSTELTTLAHVHGAVFSAWVLLFIVQTLLISRRRLSLHRRLGVAGVGLAAVMIVVGWNTAIAAAARGAAPPGADPLAFLVVPLFDLLLFSVFVTLGVLHRRHKESHKRLMLMAYISIMAAAIARLPGMLAYGPLAFFAVTFGFVMAGMAYDAATRRRLHPVYLWGGAAFLVSVPLRLSVSQTAAWRAFAESIVR